MKRIRPGHRVQWRRSTAAKTEFRRRQSEASLAERVAIFLRLQKNAADILRMRRPLEWFEEPWRIRGL